MNKLFNEIQLIKKIQLELRELDLNQDFKNNHKVPQNIPIPTFEDYCKYVAMTSSSLCYYEIHKMYKKIYNKDISKINSRDLDNFKSNYSSIPYNRTILSVYYRNKYIDHWYKLYKRIKSNKIKEEFLKRNIFKVVEILIDDNHCVEPYIHGEVITDKDILNVIPKPTEVEYCKENIDFIHLAKKYCKPIKKLYDVASHEELMNIFKKDHKHLVLSLEHLAIWYRLKEFKQKQLEKIDIKKLRAVLKTEGTPKDKIDYELKSCYYDEKELFEALYLEKERLSIHYRKMFYYNYEPRQQSYDDLLNHPPLYDPFEEKNTSAYRWLQDYGDYGTLKNMGLLPDEWWEP